MSGVVSVKCMVPMVEKLSGNEVRGRSHDEPNVATPAPACEIARTYYSGARPRGPEVIFRNRLSSLLFISTLTAQKSLLNIFIAPDWKTCFVKACNAPPDTRYQHQKKESHLRDYQNVIDSIFIYNVHTYLQENGTLKKIRICLSIKSR